MAKVSSKRIAGSRHRPVNGPAAINPAKASPSRVDNDRGQRRLAEELRRARAELTAMRAETEAAAMRIIDLTKQLLSKSTATDTEFDMILDVADGILKACEFRDDVGQRSTRLATHLSSIEDQLVSNGPGKLAGRFGLNAARGDALEPSIPLVEPAPQGRRIAE